MPLTPGNVPNRWSNERFCITTTRMLVSEVAGVGGGVGDGLGVGVGVGVRVGVGVGVGVGVKLGVGVACGAAELWTLPQPTLKASSKRSVTMSHRGNSFSRLKSEHLNSFGHRFALWRWLPICVALNLISFPQMPVAQPDGCLYSSWFPKWRADCAYDKFSHLHHLVFPGSRSPGRDADKRLHPRAVAGNRAGARARD